MTTIEGAFTKKQLEELRANASKIQTVDPDSPTIKKINKWISRLDEKSIQALIDAKIKFISSKALTEKILRVNGGSIS